LPKRLRSTLLFYAFTWLIELSCRKDLLSL
jgi:hypothetical protein